MNYELLRLIVCIALSGACSSVGAQQRSESLNKGANAIRKCRANPDPQYDRARVLQELADILNQSIPEYPKAFKRGFYAEAEKGFGFFVVDLTNPANKQMKWTDCVDFVDGHVYHVAPFDGYYSLSHIVIPEEGHLRVFKTVNCPDRGDRIEDAISYVSAKLSNDKKRQQILNRLRNYGKYGFYGELNHGPPPRGEFICKHGKQRREGGEALLLPAKFHLGSR